MTEPARNVPLPDLLKPNGRSKRHLCPRRWSRRDRCCRRQTDTVGTALLADAVGLNQELIGAGACCGVICKPVVFEGYAEHPLFCLFLPAQIGLGAGLFCSVSPMLCVVQVRVR